MMTQSTKLRLFPLCALLLLMMPGCSKKQEGAAASSSGSGGCRVRSRARPTNRRTHYLRVYLAQLRRKLEPQPSRPRHLVTEAGIGYRFEP